MAHPKGVYIRFPFNQQPALDFDSKIPFPYLPLCCLLFLLLLGFICQKQIIESPTLPHS